jgi:hypothetical protein
MSRIMNTPRAPIHYGKTGITLEAPVVCQDGELEWAIVYACRKYTTVKSVSDATRSSLDAKLVTALSAARNLTIIPTITPDIIHQLAGHMYVDVVFHTVRAPRKEMPDVNSTAATLLVNMAAETRRLHETRAKYLPQKPLEEKHVARDFGDARDMAHDEAVRNAGRTASVPKAPTHIVSPDDIAQETDEETGTITVTVRRGFVGTVTLTIDTDSLQKTN